MCVAAAGMVSGRGYKGPSSSCRAQSSYLRLTIQDTKVATFAPLHANRSCASSKQTHTVMSDFFWRRGVDTFTLDPSADEYSPSFFPNIGEGVRTLGVSFVGLACVSCSLIYSSICRASNVKAVLQRGRKSGSLKGPTARSAAPRPRVMITTTTTPSLRHEEQPVQCLVFQVLLCY